MLSVSSRVTPRSLQSILSSTFPVFGVLCCGIGLFLFWIVGQGVLHRVWLSSMIVAAFSLLIMSAVRIRSDTLTG